MSTTKRAFTSGYTSALKFKFFFKKKSISAGITAGIDAATVARQIPAFLRNDGTLKIPTVKPLQMPGLPSMCKRCKYQRIGFFTALVFSAVSQLEIPALIPADAAVCSGFESAD